MDALGVLPFDRGWFGGECAGTVSRVGASVSTMRVGDEVIAIAPHSFGSFAITDYRFAVVRPANINAEEASTIPVAFLTAYQSLHTLARLNKGDRILIHAAAGGVGLAAVQLALRAGAEVYGTAGNESKREYLRSIGVTHTLNSRSLDFAAEILRLTEGSGVDVVLNSLSGEFIERSLSVLRPGGKFIEIGKTNIWSPQRVAERIGGKVSYCVYDLVREAAEFPEKVASVFKELIDLFGRGQLKPLPRTVFKMDDALNAFRFMQQARHIGKIVLTPEREAKTLAFRSDASYLITGGLAGLGLEVARWMISRGARNLVLMGRSQASNAALTAIATMEAQGANVRIEQADVSRPEDVARVLAAVSVSMPALRGIIHSAGVLDDGVILQQSSKKFMTTMRAKVDGAWNLHTLTQALHLDFFVLFSSVASMFGSPGQSNHAAANAFLDMLAYRRRATQLPAQSINWGAWDRIGAAASRNTAGSARMTGIESIQPEEGLRALTAVMQSPAIQAAVTPMDWKAFSERLGSGNRPQFFAEILETVQKTRKDGRTLEKPVEILVKIRQAIPSDRHAILAEFIRIQVVKVLGIAPAMSIDPIQPLNELGLDSLMAVELRNALGTATGQPLPATLLFEYPTLEALTDYLSKEILQEVLPEQSPKPEPQTESAGLEQLSEDDLADLLSQQLETMKQRRTTN
jgi:myxalamid-type polyketide synthase MxaB